MSLAHFYHLGADHAWRVPLQEHVAAFRAAQIPAAVTVSIVGAPARRDEVLTWLTAFWPGVRFTETDTGFEQVTLNLVAAWAKANPGGRVLYAHTKGAYKPSSLADIWRQSMTLDVVTGWRECAAALADHDVAGSHWVTPEEFPHMLESPPEAAGSTTPYFAGNFWWATAGYLSSLPPVTEKSRWDAERWIGLGLPSAHVVRAGWPGCETFDEHIVAQVRAQLIADGVL